MLFRARGLKAWLIVLGVLLLAIIFLVILFQLFILLLPVVLLIVLLSYLFRMLNKLKKDKSTDIIDIKFKVKK